MYFFKFPAFYYLLLFFILVFSVTAFEKIYIKTPPSEKRQFNKMLWADHKIVSEGNRIFKVRTDSQILLFSNSAELD